MQAGPAGRTHWAQPRHSLEPATATCTVRCSYKIASLLRLSVASLWCILAMLCSHWRCACMPVMHCRHAVSCVKACRPVVAMCCSWSCRAVCRLADEALDKLLTACRLITGQNRGRCGVRLALSAALLFAAVAPVLKHQCQSTCWGSCRGCVCLCVRVCSVSAHVVACPLIATLDPELAMMVMANSPWLPHQGIAGPYACSGSSCCCKEETARRKLHAHIAEGAKLGSHRACESCELDVSPAMPW
jgi:hypothetical protein